MSSNRSSGDLASAFKTTSESPSGRPSTNTRGEGGVTVAISTTSAS